MVYVKLIVVQQYYISPSKNCFLCGKENKAGWRDSFVDTGCDAINQKTVVKGISNGSTLFAMIDSASCLL